MDRSQIPPLQSLTARPAPLNVHCLSWSADAELAIAVDDGIHVFLPSYPSVRRPGDAPSTTGGVPPPQYTLTLRISSKIRPSPSLNSQLFAFAGVQLPSIDEDGTMFSGVGRGPATGQGAGMFQIVRVEWSPSGMGCNLRPILLGLLTTGSVIAFGEHVDSKEAGLKSRTVNTWKILWGLGSSLPIPDAEEAEGYRFMDERITSFSWAKEIGPGKGLLAYRTEDGDVAIMSVQFAEKSGSTNHATLREGWDIQEVARFRSNGPHTVVDDLDPDYVPSASAFSLKWSPWVTDGQNLTSTLAYIAPNYVGFRRVSIVGDWTQSEPPTIEVEASDTIATCLFMASDAFVEWEDAVWTNEMGHRSARGYIGTPLVLKPFEVALTGPLQPPVTEHSTKECNTMYPEDHGSSNPISGIVIHPPDPTQKPTLPFYSLARLSATGTNHDWYETNLPEELLTTTPSWVERIRKNTTMLVSRAKVMGGIDAGEDSEDIGNESEEEDVPERLEHPFRFRIWGLASSPGGSSTAVVISKYSSLYHQRQGIVHVYFGREPLFQQSDTTRLTTEGKMWEWMYAKGPAVPNVTVVDRIKTEDEPSNVSALRQLFSGVLEKQICVFCDGHLKLVGDSAWCENDHAWAACVATGLAIMEPGISHVCAVCGMRCLRRSELEALAAEHLGPNVAVPQGSAACEGCGGKFVV